MDYKQTDNEQPRPWATIKGRNSRTMPTPDVFDLFANIDPDAVDEVAKLMDLQVETTGTLLVVLPTDPDLLH